MLRGLFAENIPVKPDLRLTTIQGEAKPQRNQQRNLVASAFAWDRHVPFPQSDRGLSAPRRSSEGVRSFSTVCRSGQGPSAVDLPLCVPSCPTILTPISKPPFLSAIRAPVFRWLSRRPSAIEQPMPAFKAGGLARDWLRCLALPRRYVTAIDIATRNASRRGEDYRMVKFCSVKELGVQ